MSEGTRAGAPAAAVERLQVLEYEVPVDGPVAAEPELFTDANDAYRRKEALAWARRFHDEFGVTWLEEPVTAEDVEGLAPGFEQPTAVPGDDAIGRAADVLNAGPRVAILAGQGARRAHAELGQVTEILGAGVARPLLITIKRYWREWADPRLVVAVLHNNDLNQVTWEMRAIEGAPKFTESQSLPDVDYAAFAASLGLAAIAVDKPDQIAAAWERALSADRPAVLDVRTDPNMPPIPPHATFGQLKDSAMAMLKGDEDRRGLIAEGVKAKVQEMLPHHPGSDQ